MRFVGLLGFFLMTNTAFAKDCHLWSVRGTVVYQDSMFALRSAEDTLAETLLTLPVEIQHKLIIFQNQYVEAKLLLAESAVPRKGKILDVEGAERVVPDPLRDTRETLFKKVGQRPCH